MINATLPDITDIPDGIKVLFKPSQKKNNDKEKDIQEETDQSEPMSFSQRSNMTCPMIIDILNDTILNALQDNCTSTEKESSTDPHAQLRNLTFKYISEKYMLDFKQAAAFEIMACSFILIRY